MNVGLDRRGSLGPADDLGLGVDADPLDRGVMGFGMRLGLDEGCEVDGGAETAGSATIIAGAVPAGCMLLGCWKKSGGSRT